LSDLELQFRIRPANPLSDRVQPILLNTHARIIALGSTDGPVAKNSVSGWILSGPAGIALYDTDRTHVSLCIAECDTNILLGKFWEDEYIPQKLPLNEEDERCEQYFVSTYSRTAEGRYTVRLPFKTGPPIDIDESLQIATALHARMEGRLQSRPEIR